MTSNFPRVLVALLSVGVLGLWPASAVKAEAKQDCRWLPDLTCGRSGRYEGFQMPIVMPYLFEDPFIVTGVYPYVLYHDFPGRSALGGGHASALAVQARLAITERLAFIATKDGYVWERPDSPLLDDNNGYMNLAGGFKYALIDRPDKNFILSPALQIEVPTGARDIFQGGGDPILIPSVSTAWGTRGLHLIGSIGGHIPTDGDENSGLFYYHAYADYAVSRRLQPFIQLSGIHYIDSGDGTRPIKLKSQFFGGTASVAVAESLVGAFEGVDIHNLGSRGVGDNNYVIFAVGSHVPISRHVTFSVAYERPISARKDISKQRVTTALRLEF